MKLSNERRARAIGQLEAGATAAHVGRNFGNSQGTSPWQISHVPDGHRFAAPNDTARNTPARNPPHISARTVWQRLKAVELRCRRPYRGAR
ncbi:hypothetical protein MAR_014379 [Mya arenaria]|nr:hypothetical protein MAR_014379 [Mya arenaria]